MPKSIFAVAAVLVVALSSKLAQSAPVLTGVFTGAEDGGCAVISISDNDLQRYEWKESGCDRPSNYLATRVDGQISTGNTARVDRVKWEVLSINPDGMSFKVKRTGGGYAATVIEFTRQE